MPTRTPIPSVDPHEEVFPPLIPEDRDPLGPLWSRRLFWGFLLLGFAARIVRYILKFPLWEDECFLAVNFIDASYADLLQPLQYQQVAPWLFLWSELWAVKTFGFNELALRLVPFIGSLAGLALFADAARRLFRRTELVAAIGVLAVAYPGIRYAAEAKQYGTDLFAAALMLNLLVRWWTRPGRNRPLWILAIVTPLLVGLSYPAVFVGGAVCIFAGILAWTRRPLGRRPWAVYTLTLVGGFAAVYFMTIRPQTATETMSTMQGFWDEAFPPSAPGAFALWMLETHTGDLLAFPFGGGNYASTLTAIACAFGLVGLWITRRRLVLLLCLLPFALTFVAALLHKYPYGGHMKFSMHLGPFIAMLAGAGIATGTWLFLRIGPRAGRNVSIIALAIMTVVGGGSIVRDTLNPHKTPSDARYRGFARWFWFSASYRGVALCVNTDFGRIGRNLQPDAWRELSWLAMFVCDMEIYSPHHRYDNRIAWDNISREWPLRCVLYRDMDPRYEFNDVILKQWHNMMAHKYELVSEDIYPMPRLGKRDRSEVKTDRIHIYTFVPKPPGDDTVRR